MFNLRKQKQEQHLNFLNSDPDFKNFGDNSWLYSLAMFVSDRAGQQNTDSKISSFNSLFYILANVLRQKREEPVDAMVFGNSVDSPPDEAAQTEFDQASREGVSESKLPMTDIETVQFDIDDDDRDQNPGDDDAIDSDRSPDDVGSDEEASLSQNAEDDSGLIPDQPVVTVENVPPETDVTQVETTSNSPVNTDTETSPDSEIDAAEPEHDTAAQTTAEGHMTMSHEHMALHELVLHSDATHVAIGDGDWFDPATWSEGAIPDDGARVLIPEGVSVEYRGESDVSLFTVRVDGELIFAHDANNFMEVDTLVVTTAGRLEIGTAETPVEQGYTTQIQIADNGPIDVTWDATLLSRGIISQGAVEMHGQAKQTHLKLAVDAMAGDTQLVLEDVPEGWNVGDKIVLTGTHLNPWHFWSLELEDGFAPQDEELVITAINGNQVTLDKALVYDHDTSDVANKASVANYTRSIIINTENPELAPVSERGHVMLMGAGEDTSVKYVSFHELGRTDKSISAVDANEAADLTSDTNVKGRYALHLHEAGVDPEDVPIVLEGNAVWGSPGWGIVQHSSFAHLLNNTTYDTFGAAFVAEAGDEIGLWSGNIAISAQGVLGIDKDTEDVAGFDLGRTGDGYWLQSRLIDVTDNIAAGVNRGFVLFHRGGEPQSLDTDNFELPEFGRYKDFVNYSHAPVRHFVENEVLASNEGLVIVKAGPVQHHDIRSVIDKFSAWEVGLGIHAEYTSHYTFKGTSLSASESDGFRKSTIGFEFGKAVVDFTLNGGVIDGFDYGAFIEQFSPWPETIEEQNLFLVGVSIENASLADIENFDPNRITIVDPADLEQDTELSVILDEVPVWSAGNQAFLLNGIKTDSLGTIDFAHAIESFSIDQFLMAGAIRENGYYVDEAGTRFVIWEEYFSDRATGRIDKIGIPIEIGADISSIVFTGNDAEFHGVIDFNKASAVAVNDSFETVQERGVEIDLVSNDDFGDNNLFRFVDAYTQPENGTVHRSVNGTLVYRPDQYFTGDDEFDYWIQSDNGTFDRATAFITVNEQPIVSDTLLPLDDLGGL